MDTEVRRVRVLFDVSRMQRARWRAPTGIDRVDTAYLHALAAAPQIDLQLVSVGALGPRSVSEARPKLRGPAAQHSAEYLDVLDWLEQPAAVGRRIAPRPARGPGLGKLFERWDARVGRKMRASPTISSVYINTSHGGSYRTSLSRWLGKADVASIFFLHDLIPITHPEFNRAREPERHARRLATVSALASHVVVNSICTRDTIHAYLRKRDARIPEMTVAPLGVGLPLGKLPITRMPSAAAPYFVVLSTIEPRKNHLLLLEVWRRLVEQLGDAAPRLVLIGRRGWNNQHIIDLIERTPALARHVVECTGMGDAELAAILRGARALLSASFIEGYGLPIAEALSQGTPVIASDIPAHREVGGEHAEYLDPLDGPAWLRAVLDYAHDSPRREEAKARLANYVAPSWRAHFDRVLPLVHEAAVRA